MKCIVWHLLPHKTKCNTLYTVTQNKKKKKLTVVVLHIGLKWNLGHIIVQDLCFHPVFIINVFIHLDDFGENVTWTIRELLTQVDGHQVNFLYSLKIRVRIKTPFLTHPLPFCVFIWIIIQITVDVMPYLKLTFVCAFACFCICITLLLSFIPLVAYQTGCVWLSMRAHKIFK